MPYLTTKAQEITSAKTSSSKLWPSLERAKSENLWKSSWFINLTFIRNFWLASNNFKDQGLLLLILKPARIPYLKSKLKKFFNTRMNQTINWVNKVAKVCSNPKEIPLEVIHQEGDLLIVVSIRTKKGEICTRKPCVQTVAKTRRCHIVSNTKTSSAKSSTICSKWSR